MRSVSPVAVLSVAALGCALSDGAGAGDAAAEQAPVVESVSPSAVHPGDGLLIRAGHLGRERPRVWIGSQRARVRSMRPAATDLRDLLVRVPKRALSGTHDVKLATRAGVAVAAKPIVVASCYPPPPFECGNVPSFERARITVTGPGGYREELVSNDITVLDLFGNTALTICGDTGVNGTCRNLFTLTLRGASANLHGPEVIANPLEYSDSSDFQNGRGAVLDRVWDAGAVRIEVVKDTATLFGICLNHQLSSHGGEDPDELTVQGYFVFRR